MKEIKLSQGLVALVDDDLFEYLNQWNWHAIKLKNSIYCRRSESNVKTFIHWVIMGRKWIDHVDGNGLNNQRSNLRFCTQVQNQMNRMPNKNSTSIYKGVSWIRLRNKWQSQINVNGKPIYIGYFKDEIEAAKAYDKKAKELFGEFARLNFKN